jgi:hypothetical protein
MPQIYSEIGFGNETFLSTEIEEGTSEYRVPKFLIPKKILGVYLRFWVGRRVLILSSKNGIVWQRKEKTKFKILFGIQGSS